MPRGRPGRDQGGRPDFGALSRQLQRAAPDDPLNQLLHRTNVTSNMEVSVVKVAAQLDESATLPLINATPTWCVVVRDGEDLYLVSGKDLAEWLQNNPISEGAAGFETSNT